MSTEKVAICIGTFNEGKYIQETITSILDQNYGDFDLFVSDNHSTDSTEEIIRNFISQDSRVKYWKPDRFLISMDHARYLFSRVNSLAHAYSIFLGGHDLLSKNYVEILHSRINENPDAAVVSGSGIEISSTGQYLKNWPDVVELQGGMISVRPSVVLQTLSHNLTAFGLWSNAVRRKTYFRHGCFGADHLFTAEASLYGDILVEPSAVIYTRQAESANNLATYFKKHVSEDIRAEVVVADFNKQLEWVRHINEVAYGGGVDALKKINLACLLGVYISRYAFTLDTVGGAMQMWLNSDIGKSTALQLISTGNMAGEQLGALNSDG